MTLSGKTIQTAPPERLRVEAVLLDVDGTLVDSNDAHARSWKDVLDEIGFDAPLSEVRRLIGMGGELVLERLTGIAPDDPRSKPLRDRRDAIFRDRYLGEVRPQPGARELVEKLAERRFTTVVVTSTSDANVRPLLEIAGIDDVVSALTTGDDVERAKPEPDVVRAGLRKAGVNADHAVLLGDTPYDVAAGRSAGVAVIALRCGGWTDEALDGAIEIFDDPKDVLKNWMQTPFRASLADLDAPL